MAFIIANKVESNSGPRVLPKAGTVPARLLSIVDLGVQSRKPWKGQPRSPVRQLVATFELPNDKMDYKGKLVPQRISTANMTLSNDPKSALYKFMQSIDPTGKNGGDLARYPGMPVLLTIVHTKVQGTDGEKTYANITGMMPAPEGFPIEDLHDKPFLFDFDEPKEDQLKMMPPFLRKNIAKAVNYSGSKVEKVMPADDKATTEEEAY